MIPLEKIHTPLADCFELRPVVHRDERGVFVKAFNREWFEELRLQNDWAEQYYSVSQKGVLRGLHFQLPPRDHAKLVFCTHGKVLDVAVDVRRGSPTFGLNFSVLLDAEVGNMMYLGTGLAHGFFTLSATATMIYSVTSVYDPALDSGIRWDSAGITWPDLQPRISARDRGLPSLAAFESPFEFVPSLVGRR